METEFEPVRALAGGALIGLSALILMVGLGRIAGVSGIVARLLPPRSVAKVEPWGLAFVAGLIVAPLLHKATFAAPLEITMVANPALLILGGAITGFGTVLGNGCTSGHGVCGISRLSVRSIVATCVFLGTAVVTVTLLRQVFGITGFGAGA